MEHLISHNSLTFKALIIILVVVAYILLLRPVRNTLFDVQFNSILTEEIRAEENIEILILEERAFIAAWPDSRPDVQWQYKIPFGIYFLVSLIALVILNGSRKLYLLLTGIHAAALIVAALLLWAAARWSPGFLTGTDLITRYLIPFCSLALIPLAYIQKQNTENERKA